MPAAKITHIAVGTNATAPVAADTAMASRTSAKHKAAIAAVIRYVKGIVNELEKLLEE